MKRSTAKEQLRFRGPNSGVAKWKERQDDVEVSGTCKGCGETIFLKVPKEMVDSIQGYDKAMCPRCFPDEPTRWYVK